MSLFRFYRLMKFIRSHTKPIPETKATIWKKRLSLMYFFLCWNAFGLVCYQVYSGKNDWAAFYGLKSDEEKALSPGQQAARTLGLQNAAIYRVKGFSVAKVQDANTEETSNEDKELLS